jgi:hypothetical protein
MHNVIVYLLTFFVQFPNMFRQIAMPSSEGYYYKLHKICIK